MHELGHNLGLKHGGNDGKDHKPNYFSVMNYTWQIPIRGVTDSSWALVYSVDTLATLNERNLIDAAGIGFPVGHGPKGFIPVGPPVLDSLGWSVNHASPRGKVDWDGDNSTPSCDTCDINRLWYYEPESKGDTLYGATDIWRIQASLAQTPGPLWSATLWREDGLFSDLGEPLPIEMSFHDMAMAESLLVDCNGNGVSDLYDIRDGVSLDANHNYLPDECEEPRIAGLPDSVVACPGGDGDAFAFTYDLEGVYAVGSGAADYVKVDSLESGVTMWRADGSIAAVGDTINEVTRDYLENDDIAAFFDLSRISGCGWIKFSIYSGDNLIAHNLRTYVRSYDVGGVLGGVDRLEIASFTSLLSLCPSCNFSCNDFNLDGHMTAADRNLMASHKGHHITRRLIAPNGGQVYAPGEAMPISWVRGYGDSANVSLLLLREAPVDSIMIAVNLPDTGSYTWTVPATIPAHDFYRVLVRHSAGTYFADYVSLGSDTSNAQITVLPSRVTAATLATGRTSTVVSWTESGQAGVNGAEYDIRRSTSTINDGNFASGTSVTPDDVPGPQGTEHCVAQSTGISSCTTYYYAMKTRVGTLWSRVSNVASAQTKCSGSLAVGCEDGDLLGGGGGEDMLRIGPGGLSAQVQVPRGLSEGPIEENSVLPGARFGAEQDFLKVPGLTPRDGAYEVRLRQRAGGTTLLRRVRLGYVDRDSTAESVVAEGSVLVGHAIPLESSWTRPNPEAVGTNAMPGDVLTMSLGAENGATALVVSTLAPLTEAFADSAGIVVQGQVSDSLWEDLGLLHPRRRIDDLAIDVSGRAAVRLLFRSACEVRSVRRLAIEQGSAPVPLVLTAADHSRLGDVMEAVAESSEVELKANDELALIATAVEPVAGIVRDVYLVTEGSFTQTHGTGQVLPPDIMTHVVAFKNSLGLAHPNPSADRFTIGYSLAKEGPVSIRVYDVAGRLVRMLVHGVQRAGPHEIVWDGKTAAGQRASAGVFFYRMQAGGWKSEHRAILVAR